MKKMGTKLSVEIIFYTITGTYYLLLSSPGWFSYAEVSKVDAEKASGIHSIDIQKKSVL